MFWKQFNIKVMAEVMHRHFKHSWFAKDNSSLDWSASFRVFQNLFLSLQLMDMVLVQQ